MSHTTTEARKIPSKTASPSIKVCKKCGLEKDIEEFYIVPNHFNNKLYRINSCKDCEAKRIKEYRRKNKEKYTQKNRQFQKQERARLKEFQQRRKRYKVITCLGHNCKERIKSELSQITGKLMDHFCPSCKIRLEHSYIPEECYGGLTEKNGGKE